MRGGLKCILSGPFQASFDRLPLDVQREVAECVEEFGRDPLPAARRPHRITARGKRPIIYSMDVTKNKAYKVSFAVLNNRAVLLLVDSHKSIDRNPGNRVVDAALAKVFADDEAERRAAEGE